MLLLRLLLPYIPHSADSLTHITIIVSLSLFALLLSSCVHITIIVSLCLSSCVHRYLGINSFIKAKEQRQMAKELGGQRVNTWDSQGGGTFAQGHILWRRFRMKLDDEAVKSSEAKGQLVTRGHIVLEAILEAAVQMEATGSLGAGGTAIPASGSGDDDMGGGDDDDGPPPMPN
jgi:hypothetical protein